MGYQFGGKMKDARPSKSGSYMPTGFAGDVEIVACTNPTTQKGDAFICEFRVLTSNLSTVPVGSDQTWWVGMQYQSAPGNVKGFVQAINGFRPGDAEACVLDEKGDGPEGWTICEEQTVEALKNNTFRGKKLSLKTFATKTRKGGDFTVYAWAPIAAAEAA